MDWSGCDSAKPANRSFAGFFMATVADQPFPGIRGEAAPSARDLPISRVDFAEFSADLLGNFRRLHQLHGPIAAIEDGGQRVVFLFSPEYNQQVLSDTE